MRVVTIHRNDSFRVDSYGNGIGYAIQFGSAENPPMRTLWFQGDDAARVRDDVEACETANPEMPTRDVWERVLDPYL